MERKMTVVVSGPAGIGKTTLAAILTDALTAHGFTALTLIDDYRPDQSPVEVTAFASSGPAQNAMKSVPITIVVGEFDSLVAGTL